MWRDVTGAGAGDVTRAAPPADDVMFVAFGDVTLAWRLYVLRFSERRSGIGRSAHGGSPLHLEIGQVVGNFISSSTWSWVTIDDRFVSKSYIGPILAE